MNKVQLRNKCQNLLKQKVLSVNDKNFLLELFKLHPHANIKIGVEIKDIFIKNTIYNNKCFYIIRNDNSETDISYIQCIDGEKNKNSIIISACRDAIFKEIYKEKSKVKFGIDKCIFTNEILTKENTHIDHYNLKFSELYKLWIKTKDIDFIYSKINTGRRDLETRIFFNDYNIILDFVCFHNKNTHLRAISKTANLKRG